LGLTDIRDIVYFPNLQRLDLSSNALRNLSPLIVLQHLKHLNVNNNLLGSVDALAFSESSEMTINVSSNYIKDFDFLTNSNQCLFLIIGMGLQNPPYQVKHFYSDFDLTTSEKIIAYNLWTYNPFDTVYLLFGQKKEATVIDGFIQRDTQNFPDKIYMTMGEEVIDTTYFIEPVTLETANDSEFITLSFPVSNYTILSVESCYSEVSFSDNTLFFKKQQNNPQDTIRIEFGVIVPNGINKIKGYTYYFITEPNTEPPEPGIVGSVKNNSLIEIYPNPATDYIHITLPENIQHAVFTLYDMQGKTLVQQQINNQDVVLVSNLAAGIYIYNVRTDKEKQTGKLIINNE
jgi:hypothetical protein